MLQYGFQLRTKHERVAVTHVIQGLYTHLVAGDEKQVPSIVPNGKAEHAGEAIKHFHAELLIGVNKHFGIAVRVESVPRPEQFIS